jgi:hypothetical protein
MVVDNIVNFFNGMMFKLGKENHIIKYMSTRRRFIKEAIGKNIGLYFKYFDVKFYVYPCKALDEDTWVMEPIGADNNVDLMIKGESLYLKHGISWVYLNLSDYKYYWQLKPPWMACWKCKCDDFELYLKGQPILEKNIKVSKKIIKKIPQMTDESLSMVLEGYSGYEFRCAGCGERCPVGQVADRYYLKMLGES